MLDSGVVVLRHGSPYSIRIQYRGTVRCDIEVECNGIDIGTFRLERFETIDINQSSYHPYEPFTFYQPGTKESMETGTPVDSALRGTVSLRFYPEKGWEAPVGVGWVGGVDAAWREPEPSGAPGRKRVLDRIKAGGSADRRYTTEFIVRDEAKAVTIQIQLAAAVSVRPEPVRGCVPEEPARVSEAPVVVPSVPSGPPPYRAAGKSARPGKPDAAAAAAAVAAKEADFKSTLVMVVAMFVLASMVGFYYRYGIYQPVIDKERERVREEVADARNRVRAEEAMEFVRELKSQTNEK